MRDQESAGRAGRIDERERDRLLTTLLRTMSLIGVLAYVPGVWMALAEGVWVVAVVDTLAYAAILLVAFVPRIPLRIKLTVMVVAVLGLAATLLFAVGLVGAGYLWLVGAILFAAIFSGTKAIVFTTAATLAILIGYAVALQFGIDGRGATTVLVLNHGTNVIVIAISIALIVRTLFARLSIALHKQEVLTAGLERELAAGQQAREELAAAVVQKDRLLHEVHHRVNNNMQTVLGLINLEREEGAGAGDAHVREILTPLYARVRVVSAVNELLHRKEATLDAAVLDLIAVVQAVLYEQTLVPTRFLDEVGGGPANPLRDARLPARDALPFALFLYDLLADCHGKCASGAGHGARAPIGLLTGGDERGAYIRIQMPGLSQEVMEAIRSRALRRPFAQALHGVVWCEGPQVTVRFGSLREIVHVV